MLSQHTHVRDFVTVLVFLISSLFSASLVVADGPCVVPQPQKMVLGAESAALPPTPIIAVGPQASEVEHYAADVLRSDLGTYLGKSAQILPASEKQPPTILIGTLESFPELAILAGEAGRKVMEELPKSEAYAIRTVGDRRQPRILVIGSDPVGALYGCLTLSQLFERKEGDVQFPWPVRIEDFPVFQTRGFPWHVNSTERLDWMARWRMNAWTYDHFYPPSSPPPGGWTEQLADDLPNRIKESHKRGLQVYGSTAQRWVEAYLRLSPERYAGWEFVPSDARTVGLIRRTFHQFADVGVDGFVLMLDDIIQTKPPEELGREHVEWVRVMKEVAAERGIKKLLMCPTHYWTGWNPKYYKPFLEAQDLGDVGMIFCPYDAEEVAAVQKAGLRNYHWWHNGVWPLGTGEWTKPGFAGLEGGLNRVEWGWYGDIDCSPALLDELRTVPDRTLHTWANTGSWPMWGAYAWNPRLYDPEKTERLVADALLGRGANEPYMQVMNLIRSWALRLRTNEGSAEEFEAAMAQARTVLATLKPIVDQSERPGLWPPEKRRSEVWLIEKDIDLLGQKAYRPFIGMDVHKFPDAVAVEMLSRQKGVELRYTLDGSDPTEDSSLYTEPLKLTRSATVRVKAFKEGLEKSHASITLHKHQANGRDVQLVNAYAPQYAAGGKGALTDGIFGTNEFGDGKWQGFENCDLDATIDLGETKALQTIEARFLQNIEPWIFLPTRVEFLASEDGETFSEIAAFDTEISAQRGDAFIHTVSAQADGRKARYVRVKAKSIGECPPGHPSAGEKAWIFVDEILVNPDTPGAP